MTRPYGGRRGALKPPPDIWDEMGAAGLAHDDVRLGIAQARYKAWLTDQGIPYEHQGSQRPDKASE